MVALDGVDAAADEDEVGGVGRRPAAGQKRRDERRRGQGARQEAQYRRAATARAAAGERSTAC